MFGFGKKTKQVSPEFIEARAFYGSAFHIVATSGDGVTAICGYDQTLPASSVREVNRDTILDTWDRQHESWHWCRGCVIALFELNENVDPRTIKIEDLIAADLVDVG